MQDQDNDPPIIEQEYRLGINVVEIGAYRIARGISDRKAFVCGHHKTVYDPKERRVWCEDCKKDIDPFDMMVAMLEYFWKKEAELKRRKADVLEAEAHSLIKRAAKALDKAWRKKRLVPCCPHCKEALFPEDFENGVTHFKSMQLERARRKKVKS